MPKRGHAPLRRCVACRRTAPKSEFIRLVRSNEQEMQIDNEAKMAGRGAYICRNEDCIQNALKRKSFERALKTGMPKEVAETLTKAGNRKKDEVEGKKEIRS